MNAPRHIPEDAFSYARFETPEYYPFPGTVIRKVAGEPIQAREAFAFEPQFRIDISGHHRPASQTIGDTVARWRERDASAADEQLLTDVIDDVDDGDVERDFAMMFAIVLILWIVGGVALAVTRGAH